VDYGCCLCASVIFPKKAKSIKKLTIYAWDNSTSDYLYVRFYRVELATGTTVLLGDVSTTDSTGPESYEITVSDTTLSKDYAYFIGLCVRPSIYMYGAVAKYK
jgi:hypothetical protein